MSTARREVATRLHSAAIHLLRAVRVADSRSGLSPARLSALSVLVFGGPRTVGGLAGAEGVRSPTMTQLVNGLEADGLVRRQRQRGSASTDARRVLVEATPAGERLMREAQSRRLDVLLEILAAADRSDIAALDHAATLLDHLLHTHPTHPGGVGG